ncbi:MAG: RnfABCDGE type electron transport complex subunit D [Bergeyella sp.]|nr:RnfABCDGE type electron transport complex subunit D [Bergeyella sp.]
MSLHPHIKPRFNSTQLVMFDVLIALFPVLIVGWMAYGKILLVQLGVALGSALVTDFVFSSVFLKKYDSVLDGSSVVTAILLVCTLAPLTPWYVVSFGAFSAILLGKIVWGGLGKNRFNPALVGREFMSVFFTAAMTSPMLWKSGDLIRQETVNLFHGMASPYVSKYLSAVIYKTDGAMGEYSILAIFIGGLYLLFRSRISWHIPLSLLLTWSVLSWINGTAGTQYSVAGILLGTVFMATDMPSSPTTPNGKLFYGVMTGVCLFIFIKEGIRFEYMSFSILLMNGFADRISMVFNPRAWGEKQDYKRKMEEVFVLTLKILTVSFAVLTLYRYGWINYVVFTYMIYIVFKFNFSFAQAVNKYV